MPYSATNLLNRLFLPILLSCLFTLNSCQTQNKVTKKVPAIQSEQTILETAKKIHDKVIVLDAHADIVTPSMSANFLSQDGLSKVDVSKLKNGGVNAVVMSIAVSPGPRTAAGDAMARVEANEKLDSISAIVKREESIVLATSAAAVKIAQQQGKIAFILGFQNARSLKKEVSAIDSFYNAGVRIFGLNHLGHNDFSDSSRPSFDSETGTYEPDAEHGGLSTLGVAAVKRINKLGGIIDVSQLSKAATIQTLELSTAPIIASHTNVRAISDVSRNITNEEIDLIGQKDGVVHIAPFRAYLLDYSDPGLIAKIKAARRAAGVSEKYSYPFELYWEIKDPAKKYAFLKSISDIIGPADVSNLIEHIDYIVKRIGIDHVGIGTDFNHGSGIDGYLDSADALNVTVGLVRKGYSAADIQKIWGGNFLRVMAEAEQVANRSGGK